MAGELILVADDDPDIVRFVEVNLRLEGFEVQSASNGSDAIRRAREIDPELILLDWMMPDKDGLEVCQALRADPATAHVSIVMLTAKAMAEDRIAGLDQGADDYICKPFDPAELIARVKSALRRKHQMRAVSPLTNLPGNFQIAEELQRRLTSPRAPWALAYADLDNFKPFNDKYGFMRGDLAIRYTSQVLLDALGEVPEEETFIGHVGGDDFVVIMSPADYVEVFCRQVCERFDAGIRQYYDPEDASAGYIDVADRQQEVHRFPLLSISIGVAWNRLRKITSHFEAAAIAAEMKAYAKRIGGSSYAIDRRRGE